MKSLLVLAMIGAAVFFGYPLMNEDTSSECDALERATVRLAFMSDDTIPQSPQQFLGQFFQGFSKGQFASLAVRNEYPNVPVSVGCAMLYWRTTVDPKGFREGAGTPQP